MSIVTGAGDDGYSSLFGGQRVPKHHPRLEAYGAIDEAQCAIGMVRSAVYQSFLPEEIDSLLDKLQKDMFVVGSDLATPDKETKVPRVTSTMIRFLEDKIKQLENDLPRLTSFIVPSGTPWAATCFWARAVARRAERRVAELLATGQDVSSVLIYMNRLGDLLFLIGRLLNREYHFSEEAWLGDTSD